MNAILSLFLFSAAAQDFGPEGALLLHLPRLSPPPAADFATKTKGETISRVCDEETWKELVAKARKSGRTQTVAGTSVVVHILTTSTAVKGQDCEAGAHAENSFFLALGGTGAAPDLYPARISAVCRDASGVRDSFSLDADLKGNILAATIYNGSLGVTTHPISEPLVPSSEISSLQAFLGRLVRLFLETN